MRIRSSTTGSGDLTLCEIQVPLGQWVAPGKVPFPGYLAGRQDSLAIIGNLSEGNPQ
jgi:hypothetical protein